MAVERKGHGGVRKEGKTLLRNIIRHTDTHNRLLEEADMWSRHVKMKDGSTDDREKDRGRDRRPHERYARGNDKMGPERSNVKHSFLYDDRESVPNWSSRGGPLGMRRAHMDGDGSDGVVGAGRKDRKDGIGTSDRTSTSSSSTYWMRKLYSAEAGDEERWGHAGYKELYPGDFKTNRSDSDSSSDDSSSSSSSSSSSDSDHRKRKRKKSSSRSMHRKKKRRKEKKGNERKKRKHSGSTSEEDDDESERETQKKRKRREEESRERKRRKSDVKEREKNRHKSKKKKKKKSK